MWCLLIWEHRPSTYGVHRLGRLDVLPDFIHRIGRGTEYASQQSVFPFTINFMKTVPTKS